MNAVVYREPYKLPAGILAVAVHGAFFALLYFGFTWQAMSPATMSVELWQSLPEMIDAPPVQPRIEKVVPPPQPEKVIEPEVVPPQPEKVVEPEIVLPEEEKPDVRLAEQRAAREETERVARKKAEKAAREKAERVAREKAEQAAREKAERVAREKAEKAAREKAEQAAREKAEQAAREKAERVAREKAEQAAAIGRVVDEYTGKIVSKIRRNIVMPPDVADDARAEFSVTLLPGGTVLGARLTRSSGNAAYDNAVERAILKSQPLPLPADMGLFSKFRELELVFKPIE
ncbi:MAG: cell envelope integrity protein TolA [Gallionella sp.]|nr:cell envelope integrity protein TolA [Gallionella sp.]